MWVTEKDARKCICHKTIGPNSLGRKCKGAACTAWEPVEIQFKCTACDHINTPAGLSIADSFGKCTAKYKYG